MECDYRSGAVRWCSWYRSIRRHQCYWITAQVRIDLCDHITLFDSKVPGLSAVIYSCQRHLKHSGCTFLLLLPVYDFS